MGGSTILFIAKIGTSPWLTQQPLLGDRDLRARHYALAKDSGEAIKDAEDKRIFLETFSRIPTM